MVFFCTIRLYYYKHLSYTQNGYEMRRMCVSHGGLCAKDLDGGKFQIKWIDDCTLHPSLYERQRDEGVKVCCVMLGPQGC